MAEGVVPGGGATFVHLSRRVPILKKVFQDSDEKIGTDIVGMALVAPAKFIAANAGFDGDVVVERILFSSDSRVGYNVMNGRYEDLIAAGVIDPCCVSRCALRNAVSNAGTYFRDLSKLNFSGLVVCVQAALLMRQRAFDNQNRDFAILKAQLAKERQKSNITSPTSWCRG